jgi:hypothetical protein
MVKKHNLKRTPRGASGTDYENNGSVRKKRNAVDTPTTASRKQGYRSASRSGHNWKTLASDGKGSK